MPAFRPSIASAKKDDSLKTATEGAPLTAYAGGGQANATLLDYGANEVGTVTNVNDSVRLPPAVAGKEVHVANSAANSMQVFGDSAAGDTINGVATGTGVAMAGGKNATFFCVQSANSGMGIPGKWRMVLSA